MALVLRYATPTQLGNAFRARYKATSQTEAARLATWLINRINDGTFTDAQVQGAFGLSAGQYTTLKTKFTNLSTAYNAVIAAQGE